MRLTVDQIMQQVAATVNQEATSPTAGGAEYNLWLQYINRSYREWVESNDWEALRKTFFPSVAGVSVASVALPLDFNKMAAPVKLHNYSSVYPKEIPYVLKEEIGLYHPLEEYHTLVGDSSSGWNLVFNPGTMASGASIEVQYFSVPTSLATTTEIPLVPDGQFLVDRTIAYIFEARSDPRFQIVETKARERLLAMVENSTLAKYNSYSSPTPILSAERRAGFRVGRD